MLSVSIALPSSKGELNQDDLCRVLSESKAAGAITAALLDHPDKPWPERDELIDFAQQAGLSVEWFTEGKGIDAAAARELARRNVTVALRIDTLDESLQNQLSQNPQAWSQMQAALVHLTAAGYGKPDGPTLAASISLCPANFSTLPALWRWLREQNIQPWLQVVSPDRLAHFAPTLLNPAAVEQMFESLREQDQRESGIIWKLPAGVTSRSNDRPLRSCHIEPDGTVLPCAGLHIPIGSVRNSTVGDILIQSEVLENLRQYELKLKSPCREHVHEPTQLCCRATAWQLTGDYLGADPLCPHTLQADCKIIKLPTEAWPYIPHGPSIRTIDTLVEIIEHYTRTRWTIPADSPLVNAQGRLDGATYIEIIAQSFAASHGFHLSEEERKNHRGLLLGVKKLTIHDHASAGDTLEILIHRIGRFANFGIVHGTISHTDGRLIAQGEVKIWRPPNQEELALIASSA